MNMKNIYLSILALAASLTVLSGCIKEIFPQTSVVTKDQVADAPGSTDLLVNTITSTLVGQFTYSGSDTDANDFGLPTFYLIRDVMGQDISYMSNNGWWGAWYKAQGLGPGTTSAQIPWTYYYKWIKNCNTVLSLTGEEPSADNKVGAGIARAMRAYFYLDLAQMYGAKTYTVDKNALTVPIVDEKTTTKTAANNPRATNEKIFQFIIDDLDKAEVLLDGYKRSDVYTPDKSVVYGLKARAYLVMGQWKDAAKYAKLAQEGYKIMDEDAYTNWETGFNTPNSSWMLGTTYKADDPNILLNDADSSWGSMMCIEINPETSGCGYAANYGDPFLIDRHLYETIPATDFRKKCYVDFAIDEMDEAAQIAALSAYTKHPEWILNTGSAISQYGDLGYCVGGLNVKFRTAGGEAGRDNQYIGFVVAVPMMRVEEMVLIEAEAVGRESEAEGKALLEAFAKTRDANYVFGQHNEAYGNKSTSAFINEIWWQRRIEFWGEGLATYDIKRLQKGIIRNYEGSNHAPNFHYYSETTPAWMNFVIVQTETNYNLSCTNNPEPQKPEDASDKPVTSF